MLGTTRIKLKLFIEEIEVPITSISMTTSSQLSASIEALATKESLKVSTGSNVVVAYSDPATFKAQGKKTGDYNNYFVLFIGQVADVTLQRQAQNRSLSLSCIGHRAALGRSYLYVYDAETDPSNINSRFMGAGAFFAKATGGELSRKVKELFSDDYKIHTPGFNSITGPARGVVALIERGLGYNPPGKGKQVPAQTNYLALENENKKILNQIAAVSTDNFVESVITNSLFSDQIAGSSSKLTGTQSILTLIKVILAQFYYEFLPVGAPIIKEVEVKKTELMDVYKEVLDDHSVHAVTNDDLLKSEADIFKNGFINARSVTEMRFALIQIADQDFKEDIESGLASILSSKFLNKDFYKEGEHYQKVEVARILHDVLVSRLNLTLGTIEFTEGVNSNSFLRGLNASIREAILDICAVFVAAIRQSEPSKVDQTINYVLVPNLFFATPPACNVLFPNQIFSYNTVASRYSNPTRLMLQVPKAPPQSDDQIDTPTQQGKSNNLTYTRYYAPSVEVFAAVQGTSKIKKENNLNTLLPHEENTGIVPIFKQTSFITDLKNIGFKTTGDKDQLYIRLANFELMASRYEKNIMSVSGPFNPFAVAGFPCTVIDTDSGPGESTTYVGLLSSLSHSVSTNNASTSYTVTHVRPIDEIDSIFKNASLYKQKKSKNKSTLHSTNASDPLVSIVLDISEHLDPISHTLWSLATIGFDSAVKAANSSFSNDKETKVLSHYYNRKLIGRNEESVATSKGVIELSFSAPQLISLVESLYPETFEVGSVKAVDLGLKLAPEDNYIGVAFGAEKVLADSNGLINLVKSYLRVKVKNHKGVVFSDTYDEVVDKIRSGKGKDEMRHYVPRNADDLKDIVNSLIQNSDNFIRGHQIIVYAQRSKLLSNSESLTETPLATEELFRPYWWGESFRTDKIGEKVYYGLLGSASVQDILPSDVPKDAVVMDSDSSEEIPIVSTKSAIAYSHQVYDSLNTAKAKESFVRTYIDRGLVSVNELFSLYKTRYERGPLVVDTTDQCGFGKVKVVDNRGIPTEVDPETIKLNRERKALMYKNSLNRKAFK
tara:strand:+ start:1467 stop:4649 length:3183 start_codon:yes stop_codon:yes gene_type:complete